MSVNIVGIYDVPMYDYDSKTQKKVKIQMYKLLVDLGDGNSTYIYADEHTTGFDLVNDIKRIIDR